MATEKRLIYADDLIAGFEWLQSQVSNERAIELNDHIQRIKDAPTVDAVEVVHGRWFSLTDCSNAGVYCSVCHKKVWKEDYAWCNRKNKLRSNYCPNCGAKMDKNKNL